MYKIHSLIGIISFSFFAVHATLPEKMALIQTVDFDHSMALKKEDVYNRALFNSERIPFFREQYNAYKSSIVKLDIAKKTTKIPRIIHQIWLGSSFPEGYKVFQKSWQTLHPNWQYRLWTDADIDHFGKNIAHMIRKASNYGEASDIMRYAILYRYGGLYVDTDFECIKPMDLFHLTCDFFVGLQPLDTNAIQLNNALIGSAPKNLLFKEALKRIKKSKDPRTVVKTGPLLLTQVYIDFYDRVPGMVCAFPATIFYPCGFTQTQNQRASWLKSESYAVHHWHASWITGKDKK